MKYKAYRIEMVMSRLLITLAVCAATLTLLLVSVLVAILIAVSVFFVGLIFILYSLNNEITYTVYDTRVVIKPRGKDKRLSVPVGSIVAVKYRRAFYEKKFSTGTVVIYAKTDKGGKKKYKLKHIFDAQKAIDFLSTAAERNKDNV